MIQYCAMIPAAICSVLYITDTLRGEKNTKYLKPFLVPLLAVGLLFTFRYANRTVLLAMLFGWLGDIFLLAKDLSGKNQKRFLLGLFSFFIGHVMYLISMLPVKFDLLKWKYYLILIVALFTLAITVFRYLGDCIKDVKIPFALYQGVLLAIDIMAFTKMLNTDAIAAKTLFLGTLIFTSSDTILGLGTFKMKMKYQSFWVMLTYISAQWLVAGSLYFLG